MKDATVIQMNRDTQRQFQAQINELKSQFQSLDRLTRGSILVMKDYDAQLTTMKDMLFSKGMISEEEYNTQVDARRGLRIMEPLEKIQNGDIAWVNYEATANPEGTGEQIVATDREMPIRVGSGAITFEPALVGQHIGATVTHVQQITEEGPLKGKDITFKITILKAKTKIVTEETQNAGANTDGTNGSLGAEPNNNASVEAGGPGNQELNASSDSTIQDGGPTPASEGSDPGVAKSTDSDGNGGRDASGTENGDTHDSLPKTTGLANGAFQDAHV